MREKIKSLVIADVIFIALLTVSGMINGVLSNIVYFSAFIIPFLFVVITEKIDIKSKEYLFPLKNPDIAAASVFPTLITVIVISTLTASLMSLFGKENTVELGDSLALALLSHALLPAVLEEGLFRYLPMKLLAGRNGRVCVLISAILFSLAHHSLFSIPYAFIAGVAFMTIDIVSGSVLPSLVMHLVSNALSVVLMFYSVTAPLSTAIYSVISVLACLSLIYLTVIREKVARIISERFVTLEKYKFSYEILLFAVPMLVISVSELLI